MAKLIPLYDIACIGGFDVNLRELSQERLKIVQKLHPHLVTEEKKKVKNEVSESEPIEPNATPNAE